jgi:hypothetical protein
VTSAKLSAMVPDAHMIADTVRLNTCLHRRAIPCHRSGRSEWQAQRVPHRPGRRRGAPRHGSPALRRRQALRSWPRRPQRPAGGTGASSRAAVAPGSSSIRDLLALH